MAEESKTVGSEGAAATKQAEQGVPVQIPVDTGDLTSVYANFFRVTGTPEELVLDFGLNTTQVTQSGAPEAVKLNHRLVMSFYTAKRLLSALQWAVNRYETNFGVLETDFQRRMRNQPRQPFGQ
jgi:hypothetical protein